MALPCPHPYKGMAVPMPLPCPDPYKGMAVPCPYHVQIRTRAWQCHAPTECVVSYLLNTELGYLSSKCDRPLIALALIALALITLALIVQVDV